MESGGGRLVTIPRAVFVAAVLATIAIGYHGMALYVPTKPGLGTEPWDLIYYDLQLFTLGSDALQEGPPFNIWLEIARFLLPVLALSAVSAIIARMLNASLRRLARGHVIVVGSGAEAATITAVLRDHAPTTGVLRRPAKVFQIPTGDAKALRLAGITHAARLIVCGQDTGDADARELRRDSDDNATNLAAANVAVRLRRHRPGLTVHILVRDPSLALALRARRLVKHDHHEQPVHIFTMDELAARNHMRKTTFTADAPHLLVVGGTTFGQAIIVEYALRRRREGPDLPPVAVTLVDDRAQEIIDDIHERYPFVVRILNLIPQTQPAPGVLQQLEHRPTKMYVCSEDEGLALGLALTAAGHWQPERRAIVVRLNRLRGQSLAFRDGEGAELFDDLGEALDFVTVPESATEELDAFDVPMLELARNIHERFLHDAVQRGEAMGSTRAMVVWEDLPEEYRAANLSQARDFPAKLAAIRATVAPRSRLIQPFVLTDDEVELLAIAEHRRWSDEKLAAGWSYGPDRDERRRVNPLLVSWERLDKEGRDKNRDIVRDVPLQYNNVLELLGMQIIRLAPDPDEPPVPRIVDDELTPDQVEDLARASHAVYYREHPTRGDDAYVPWDSLAETYRESNRAQARDIGRKLALIRASVSRTAPPEPFRFTEAEVELLAQYEHRRWMAERIADGWRHGTPRDNERRLHPDLVGWADLSEEAREKDRTAVRHIPGSLVEVGLHIVRRPRPIR